MNERQVIDQGWFYVRESSPKGASAEHDEVLSRRKHGYPGKIEVVDRSVEPLCRARLLRAAAAVGFALEEHGRSQEHVFVQIGEKAPVAAGLSLSVSQVEQHRHRLQKEVSQQMMNMGCMAPSVVSGSPGPAARRVLFFESLMNTDMPHNDAELSQGVLHMASALRAETEAVFANVKMSITGRERPTQGLEGLREILAGGPVQLVCITLLEGYFDGVESLIRELRALGCRAHIAVGGVMPSLTPEHVAAHLAEVSFVCRGAGEVFVPLLADVVGNSTVDESWTPRQVAALQQCDGLLAIDQAGRRLVVSNIAHTVRVADLNRVKLDLSKLQPHHMLGGVEISTSRGCIHRCTFCSIMGRESYQARSAESVLELLGQYQERFRDIWGEEIPGNAYRVHFSDDDFACDTERAITFFRSLLDTPFRLSSVQVSIADLCRREQGVLLPEVRQDVMDAIVPECFADNGRPIPTKDYVADFYSRSWSSFLQLGVESYADRELIRLGKGYRVAHIRAVVAEMSKRHLHMDGYFILSNSETSRENLIDVLDELCRLKLLFPKYFHIRFPIVPRLVSYFPSASHRRLVRRGRQSWMEVRRTVSTSGYPEFDYPFVEHDIPQDPLIFHVADGAWFRDGNCYTQSMEELATRWRALVDSGDVSAEEAQGWIRQLDDRPRRLIFELLALVRGVAKGRDSDWPDVLPKETQVLENLGAILGPKDKWLPAFRRFDSNEVPRLVVIPTWECELRCRYCFIPKQTGREMSWETMKQAIDFLLCSQRSEVLLQFFGGEALIERETIRKAMEYGTKAAHTKGKRLGFILSTNGWTLDEATLDWLGEYPVKLELSLDGQSETQNAQRRALKKGADSYKNSIAAHSRAILASGLDNEVIMVVHPSFAHQLEENFFHIASLGFERIQINFALGFVWTTAQQRAFAESLFAIGRQLKERWARGEKLILVNLEGAALPMRLNGEVTVDYDGTIYGGNGFLHETEHKEKFRVGHLDDWTHFDRHWLDIPTNETLLSWSYPEEVTANNLAVGALFTSFLKWMHQSYPVARRGDMVV